MNNDYVYVTVFGLGIALFVFGSLALVLLALAWLQDWGIMHWRALWPF